MAETIPNIPAGQNPQASTPGSAKPGPSIPPAFSAKPMHIGVFSFLNIQPLIWGLKDHHHLIQAAPNQMGGLLKEGKLDVAVAPIVAKFLNPGLQIVPVAAISSKGKIQSVRLLSHRPLQEVQRLWVDDRSQASVLMARLILKKWFGIEKLEVEKYNLEAFQPNQTKPWEAVLQFGDAALLSAPSGMTVTDLGEEWFLRTQKPFIHAAWMARDASIARDIEPDLLTAKTEGLKHTEEIVNNYRGLWVFHRPMAREYLEKYVCYDYGPEELKGQLEFEKLLREEKLI